MEVKAIYRYARISPLKARDVARAVQGLPVSNALDMLQFTPKKAAFLIGKTLKSAVANAENNHDLSADDLIVKSATVNEGPAFKRWKARARGGAAPIHKRTAHIYITLSDEGAELRAEAEQAKRTAKKKTAKKKTAKAAPVEEEEVEVEVEETAEATEAEAKAPEEAVQEAEEVKTEESAAEVEEEPKAESEPEEEAKAEEPEDEDKK